MYKRQVQDDTPAGELVEGDAAQVRAQREVDARPRRHVEAGRGPGVAVPHEPAVADTMWKHLVNPEEESDIRVELAVALGQYPRDDVFQALCTALDQRELAVNLAAADSLRLLTAEDFSLDRGLWLGWYRAQSAAAVPIPWPITAQVAMTRVLVNATWLQLALRPAIMRLEMSLLYRARRGML